MTNETKLSYGELHKWIRNKYGKANYCSNNHNHKSKRFEWANISGKYLQDINDFKPLCSSCHQKMDYTEDRRRKVIKQMIGNKIAARKVKQFNKQNELIKEFSCIIDAEKELNILHTSIANVLSGRAKTAGGFIWKY